MSYNPAVHGKGNAKVNARQRKFDPRAGKRHSDIVKGHGPRGMNIEDMRNRKPTSHGWKILYFEGEKFSVFYEYFCARNGTGIIKNEEHDRVVRVLAGTVYVTIGTNLSTLYTNMAMALPKGTEYEIATSGDTDAELLICEGPGYMESITRTTDPHVGGAIPRNIPKETASRSERVDPERSKRIAEQMKEKRAEFEKHRQEPQNKTVVNELGEEVPAPSREQVPLSGQQVTGNNPMPVGAGGYSSNR